MAFRFWYEMPCAICGKRLGDTAAHNIYDGHRWVSPNDHQNGIK